MRREKKNDFVYEKPVKIGISQTCFMRETMWLDEFLLEIDRKSIFYTSKCFSTELKKFAQEIN